MFKKGDYIVCLLHNSAKFKYRHCYKQYEDCIHLFVEQDSYGELMGWNQITFDTKGEKWRYASPAEISCYEINKGPFNTDNLKNIYKPEKFKIGDVVTCKVKFVDFFNNIGTESIKDIELSGEYEIKEILGNGLIKLNRGYVNYVDPFLFTKIIKKDNMFKKGDYIVLLHVSIQNDSYKYKHCYKQKKDADYLISEIDSLNNVDNGWPFIAYKKSNIWRYATENEIEYYEMLGNPFNVDVISNNELDLFKKGDYIIQLYKYNSGEAFIYGDCYKQRETNHYLKPELDSKGSSKNGWPIINNKLNDYWRYASPKEIACYEINKKPFNISDTSKIYKCDDILINDLVTFIDNDIISFNKNGTIAGYCSLFNEKLSFRVINKEKNGLINLHEYGHDIYFEPYFLKKELPKKAYKVTTLNNRNIFKEGERIEPIKNKAPYYDEVRREPIDYFNFSAHLQELIIDRYSEKVPGLFKIKGFLSWYHEIDFKRYKNVSKKVNGQDILTLNEKLNSYWGLTGTSTFEESQNKSIELPEKDSFVFNEYYKNKQTNIDIVSMYSKAIKEEFKLDIPKKALKKSEKIIITDENFKINI